MIMLRAKEACSESTTSIRASGNLLLASSADWKVPLNLDDKWIESIDSPFSTNGEYAFTKSWGVG